MSTQSNHLLVGEVMIKNGLFPTVKKNELLKETIEEMNKYGLGIACIVDSEDHLKGILTDGDIRRLILKVQKPIAAVFVDDYTGSIERVVNEKEIHTKEPFYFSWF